MVCLGNICRSPLAEGVMQHLVKEAGLNWHVDSAGTGNWHVGEGPDRRSTRTARNHGIDISKQVCRVFRTDDFDTFDVIFVMDKGNLGEVLRLAGNDVHRQKVRLLMGDQIVPDPYFDDTMFEPVFNQIERGCRKIIEEHNSR